MRRIEVRIEKPGSIRSFDAGTIEVSEEASDEVVCERARENAVALQFSVAGLSPEYFRECGLVVFKKP
jgi:hypothetical protein